MCVIQFVFACYCSFNMICEEFNIVIEINNS